MGMKTKPRKLAAIATDDFYEEPLDEPSSEDLPSKPTGTASDGHGTAPDADSGAVLIDGAPYWIVQGDLLVDRDEVELYRSQQRAQGALRAAARFVDRAGLREANLSAPGALIGMQQGGKILRWAPDAVLSYCVLHHTFPRQEWYDEVVDNMRAATAEWEQTCGVRFAYRSELDRSGVLRPSGVLFPVRHISANGAFIAAAFFPNDPLERRRLLIDPSYFTARFDRVGVLRHELGHVLGFRHEHIRSGAPAVCPRESIDGTIDLSAYDPKSVMHYFCGDVGSRELRITDVDRTGSRELYGPPLGNFEFLSP
jgi:hypothetical protein